MKHDEVLAWLGPYLEGDLALGQRALVDAHLDGCTECARELRQLRATVTLLRSLPAPPPAAHVADAVFARLSAGEGRPRVSDHVSAFLGALLRPRFVAPVAAVCGGLFAVVWLQSADLPGNAAPARATGRELAATGAASERERPPSAVAKTPRVELAASPSGAAGRAGSDARLGQGLIGASVPSEETPPGIGESREAFQAPVAVSSTAPAAMELGITDALEDPAGFIDRVFALEPIERERRIDALAREAAGRGISSAVERSLRSTRDPRAEGLAAALRRAAPDSAPR